MKSIWAGLWWLLQKLAEDLILTFVFLFSKNRITFENTEAGTLEGETVVVWVGDDKFVYVPSTPLKFTLPDKIKGLGPGTVLLTEMIYTDGGSIPQVLHGFDGFSPWAFGPAYVIHDWLFAARQNLNAEASMSTEMRARFNSLKSDTQHQQDAYAQAAQIPFEATPYILASVMKTLINRGVVKRNDEAFALIGAAVGSRIARRLWNSKAAKLVSEKHEREALLAIEGKAILPQDGPIVNMDVRVPGLDNQAAAVPPNPVPPAQQAAPMIVYRQRF